jgi:hypothetical protein
MLSSCKLACRILLVLLAAGTLALAPAKAQGPATATRKPTATGQNPLMPPNPGPAPSGPLFPQPAAQTGAPGSTTPHPMAGSLPMTAPTVFPPTPSATGATAVPGMMPPVGANALPAGSASAAAAASGAGQSLSAQGYLGMGGYGQVGYSSAAPSRPAGSSQEHERAEMSTPSYTKQGPEQILAASGVPTEEGRVKWPLGIRLLGSPEAEALKQQTEALFLVAAAQAQHGQVNPPLTRELAQALRQLQELFREQNRRNPMPQGVSVDTERVFTKLRRAPELLEHAPATPGKESGQMRTTRDRARDIPW